MSKVDLDQMTAELSAYRRKHGIRERGDSYRNRVDSTTKQIIRQGVLEGSPVVSYRPSTDVLGGLFVLAIRSAAAKYGLVANNISGLGLGDVAHAGDNQIWQFAPLSRQRYIPAMVSELEVIFKEKIKDHFAK